MTEKCLGWLSRIQMSCTKLILRIHADEPNALRTGNSSMGFPGRRSLPDIGFDR